MAEQIGKLVRDLRQILGLNQQDLADQAGTSQPTVSQIERSVVTQGPVVEALCDVLSRRLRATELPDAALSMANEWIARLAAALNIDLGSVKRSPISLRSPRTARIALDDVDSRFTAQLAHSDTYIHAAFSERAVPPKTTNAVFKSDEAPLYVARRRLPKSNAAFTQFEYFLLERKLDDIFWSDEPHSPVVIVKGVPGSGKSTLIDFYLRSYCPTQGKRQSEFKRKIPIIIDFNLTSTIEDFDYWLYREIRTSVLGSMPELESMDQFAMFEPELQFNGHIFQVAYGSLSLPEQTSVKARLVQECKSRISDRRWVELALGFISKAISGAIDLPFKYLVLCLDNLDLSPRKVVEHALELIRSWLEDRQFSLWQIYIPLWPDTIDLIRNDGLIRLVQKNWVTEIDAGEVDRDQLISRRFASVKQVSNDVYEVLRRYHEFIPVSFTKTIMQLSGGNLRRELSVWEAILSSRGLWEHFRSPRPGELLGLYALADSLMVGRQGFHHRTRNPVANIFYATDPAYTELDLLIGYHTLHFLHTGVRSYWDLCEQMGRLGYLESSIRLALSYFRDHNLIEWNNAGESEAIVVHRTVVDAYQYLLVDPAYLDNIAMTTPVDVNHLNAIIPTNSFDRAQFLSRVLSTLEFLGQLKDDEDQFVNNNIAFSENPDAFHDALEQAKIPRLFTLLLAAYTRRLENLQKGGYLSDVMGSHWDSIWTHPTYLAGRMWADRPLLS